MPSLAFFIVIAFCIFFITSKVRLWKFPWQWSSVVYAVSLFWPYFVFRSEPEVLANSFIVTAFIIEIFDIAIKNYQKS